MPVLQVLFQTTTDAAIETQANVMWSIIPIEDVNTSLVPKVRDAKRARRPSLLSEERDRGTPSGARSRVRSLVWGAQSIAPASQKSPIFLDKHSNAFCHVREPTLSIVALKLRTRATAEP